MGTKYSVQLIDVNYAALKSRNALSGTCQ